MKKTLLAVATTLIAAQSFAYLVPGGPRPSAPLVPGPSGGGFQQPVAPPLAPGPLPVPQPIGNRYAQAYINRTLNHSDVISVRRELNDLRQGDLVKTLEGVAQGLQRGSYLEVVMDAVVIARVDLSMNRAPFRLEIRRINGVDYQRLVLRSIGSTYVESIAAAIGEDAVPPMPPPQDDGGLYPAPTDPYPVDPYPPQQPDPQQPPLVPGPPGSNPGQPSYPPNNNLAGYCDDYNHAQFTVAKNFAYRSEGLDMTSDQATDWALRYNQTHACNTIEEFKARFTILKSFAYRTEGLDMTAQQAISYALSKAEFVTVAEAQQMQQTLTAIKGFAYRTEGLDLTSGEAADIARNWIERGYCGDQYVVQNIAAQYKREFDFAYSRNGLDYTKTQAKEYAVARVRHMTACGDLLR